MGENGERRDEWGQTAAEKEAYVEERFAIPGEVVSRRKRKPESKEEEQKVQEKYITLNWDEIFPKKPKEKLRWIYNAMEACREGRLKVQPVFDIIVHRKFLQDLKGSVATDVLNVIRGDLKVFSPKQQKQLTSDNFELYRKFAPFNVLDSDDDDDDAPALPPPPKVVLEEKKSRKRNKGGQARKEQSSEEGASDDDLETKRARKLAGGVERRVDTDGIAYTLEEFIEEHGGSLQNPPEPWHAAARSAFIYKE